MDYPKPEERIGPDAGGLKLEPTKTVYRAFRLVSSSPKAPAKPGPSSTSMTPAGRKIWQSKAGRSLLGSMLNGKPLTLQDKLVIDRLKQVDPPKQPPKS